MLDTLRHAYKKHRWLNWVSQILLLVLIYLLIHSWQVRNLARGPAAEISGRLLSGEQIDWQQYRGQPLLVHFWASWCPVCKMEQASIASLAQDYPVLTIAAWSGNTAEVAQYLHDENLHMPVLVDEPGELAKRWGVNAVPSSFFIDADGNIAFAEQGYTTGYGFRLRLWWLKNN